MLPYSRFYKCVHFKLEELVDPNTFATLGEAAWSLFDPLLLATLDRIRERYNAVVTVNNWASPPPGPFHFRGFRPSDCTEGAKLSGHRRGQCVDFDVAGMTADQVRADIRANQEHIDFMYITRVELGTSWVHISTENFPARIHFFNP